MVFGGLVISVFGKKLNMVFMLISEGYGVLVFDLVKFFDLLKGFSYIVILFLGDEMVDGMYVLDRVDGMGCLLVFNDIVVFICNYELYLKYISVQFELIQQYKSDLVYDSYVSGVVLSGGMMIFLYNMKM